MKNIAALRDEQLANGNPGHNIGSFLIAHSNSSEYLISQLEAYLAAAKADLDAEKTFFRTLLRKKSD